MALAKGQGEHRFMTDDEAKAVCAGQPQGAITPRREPVAWVLWRGWIMDGSGSAEIMRVYTDQARADEDFALFKDVCDMGWKYHLTGVPRFWP